MKLRRKGYLFLVKNGFPRERRVLLPGEGREGIPDSLKPQMSVYTSPLIKTDTLSPTAKIGADFPSGRRLVTTRGTFHVGWKSKLK